jgi:GNAT superfamily N-acetyltransferase
MRCAGSILYAAGGLISKSQALKGSNMKPNTNSQTARSTLRLGRAMPHVRVLAPADAAAAAAALARAFDQDPAKLALLPNPGLRGGLLELAMNARLYDTLRYGSVHAAQAEGELGAIAVWRPPGVPKLTFGGGLRAGLAALGYIGSMARAFPHIARVLLSDLPGLFALARGRGRAVARATRGPTWCLELLGTLPEHRRKGLARSLLERQMRRCDEDGAAIWLEAVDPANPPIYERFGFETVAHLGGPAWLPGYWVMRREPAGS